MKTLIEKSVDVPLSPDAAFALFTDEIDVWWPGAKFSVSARKQKKPRKISFEDHKDGLITETDDGGHTHIWGRIIAYDPGKYLAFSWFPGESEDKATVVTVTFTPTANGTRCDLTHGGFEILGPTADAVSTSYLTGWDLVLGCFVTAAAPVHSIA